MIIIDLKLKSKTNANIFVVVTDSGEYILHSDEIVRYGLSKGEVDSERFFNAVDDSERLIAFNSATKYLSGKFKTEKQMKDYLYKKEFKKPVVEFVLNKLKDYNLIDDKMYADTYKRSNPNYSVNKLKQKLFEAGVNSNIVDQVLEDMDDIESCKKHAEKFLRNKEIDKAVIDKLIRHLTSKGYGWGTIKTILNNLKYEIEEY